MHVVWERFFLALTLDVPFENIYVKNHKKVPFYKRIPAEIQPWTKKKETLEASIKRRNNLLSNENYVKKAPSNIVEKERLDLQKETDMLNNVLKEIESLG